MTMEQHALPLMEDFAASQSPQRRRRSRIEQALRLDVRELRRQGLLRQGRHSVDRVTSLEGSMIAETQLAIDLDIEHGHIEIQGRWADSASIGPQRIRLVTTRQHLGGLRWWLVCPHTGRHADVLLHFSGTGEFFSRQAFDPPPIYRCQRTSHRTHLYERIGAIRRRLRATSASPEGLFELPPRPKHMRRLTYLSYVEQLIPLLRSPDLPFMRYVASLPMPLRDLADD